MVAGRPPAEAVDEGGIPAGLELVVQPSHLSHTPLQQAGRLPLRAVPVEDGSPHPHPVAFPLAHGHTFRSLYLVPPVPPWA